MNTWGADAFQPEQPDRRVREEVKDGLAVVVASAIASTSVAVLALLVMKLAG